MKLQGKITLGNVIMVVMTVITLSVIQLYIYHQSAEQLLSQTTAKVSDSLLKQMRDRAEYTVGYLTDALINPVYLYDMEGVYDLLAPALKSDEVLAIKVLDQDGYILHSGQEFNTDFGTSLDKPILVEQILTRGEEYSQIEQDKLVLARPLYIGEALLGGLYLEYSLVGVNHDIAETQSLISAITRRSERQSTFSGLLLALALSIVSVAVSILLARTMSRPIYTLLDHSRRISQGDYQEFNGIRREDELGELATAFNEMGSSLQQRTEAIEFLAYHDPLTKLPNRTHFIRHIEELISAGDPVAQPFAVVFIDLDEFKGVNDNLGHQAGDQLLCEIATRISRNVRGSDFVSSLSRPKGVVARIGGDEFLLCLPGIRHESEAALVAERLLDAVSQPVSLGQEEDSIVLSGSLGFALYPMAGTSADELIKHADIAMYAAKADGKNTYCHFTETMHLRVQQKALIERDLRKALADFSQFDLWFQPQIELAGNSLVGAEALLRWHHPEHGLISPDDFIPIAEATGLIIPLGEWIIQRACDQLVAWQSMLPGNFHIAINLSAKQLFRQQVASVIKHLLDSHNLLPSRLHVEVTESLLMKDEQEAKKTLKAIRDAGIQVWLDDFGTGYSSLGYLREFDVDGLKIDRSFVANFEEDAQNRALCAAVISMAKDLEIQVVAEGIETSHQAEFLLQRQCDIGQGYYFAKPMTADAFTRQFLSVKTPVAASATIAG